MFDAVVASSDLIIEEQMSIVNIYPLDNYAIQSKEAKYEKGLSSKDRMDRMAEQYGVQGMRRVVEAVLLTQLHGHPHVLVLQSGSTFFALPGGKISPGEDEIEGLKRKLNNKLGPPPDSQESVEWEIGDHIATWYRPQFDAHMYPYLPAHITKPKEVKKIFIVHLPEKCTFYHRSNKELRAIPLMDLYSNASKYGTVIASIPQVLSSITLTSA